MPKTRKQYKQRKQSKEREETKQERALRAVQMAAVSGFVEDNRSLQESGLAVCNSCREYVPLRYLRIDRQVPSTLLAVFWPDLVGMEVEGSSRVLLPKRVVKVDWRFNDPHNPSALKTYDGGDEGMETEEEDEEEEEEKWDEEEEEEQKEEVEEMEEDGEEEKEEEQNVEHNREQNVEHDPVTACNMDMSKVRWPEGIKRIYLWGFNRPIEGVVWPDGLELLSFHMPPPGLGQIRHPYGITGNFNTSLDGATFPAGLREMSLGAEFNQPIENVDWPEGLERLSMPGFDQPLDDVVWPPGLNTLEFMKPYELNVRESLAEEVCWDHQDGSFDQPLDSFLPESLETLWLSNCFDQPLDGVAWPSGLAVLGLGTWISTESIQGVEWPPSLRNLVVAETFEVGQGLPPNCEVTYVQQRDSPDVDDNTIGIHPSNMSEDDGNYPASDNDY